MVNLTVVVMLQVQGLLKRVRRARPQPQPLRPFLPAADFPAGRLPPPFAPPLREAFAPPLPPPFVAAFAVREAAAETRPAVFEALRATLPAAFEA